MHRACADAAAWSRTVPALAEAASEDLVATLALLGEGQGTALSEVVLTLAEPNGQWTVA